MVSIRFQRLGTKKTPHHRIVVTEHSRAQTGRILEIVGHYNPSKTPVEFLLNRERVQHWVAEGAKVSEALNHVMRHFSTVTKHAAKK